MVKVELPDDDEIDHMPEEALDLVTPLPPDPLTKGGNPLQPTELPKVEADARLKFCRAVYSRTKMNRTPEGYFDGDTGKWVPTVREDLGVDPPRPAAPRHFKGWAHTYYLCQRACDGHDVPPDIAKFRDELWGRVHETHYVELVTKNLKAESDTHEKQQRAKEKRERLLAKAQVKESRDGRIKAAEARVTSYDGKIAKLMSKVKALETRKKRALRSIRALKRIGTKQEETT